MNIKSLIILASVFAISMTAKADVSFSTDGGTYGLVTSIDQLNSGDIIIIASHSVQDENDEIRIMTTASGSHSGMFGFYTYGSYTSAMPETITLQATNNTVDAVEQPYEYVIEEWSVTNSSSIYGKFYLKDNAGKYIYATDYTKKQTVGLNSSEPSKKFSLREDGLNDLSLILYDKFIVCDAYLPPHEQNNGYFYNYGILTNVNKTFVYKKKATYTLSFQSSGYGTMYHGSYDVTVPEGVKAYTYTLQDEELVVSHTFSTGDIIPAGTAVVVKGAPNTNYTLDLQANTAPAIPESNMLYGFDEDNTTTGEGKYYILAMGSKGLGFYYGAENGAAFTSKAHKAYLCIPQSAPVKAIAFALPTDDEATAINTLPAIAAEETTEDAATNACKTHDIINDISGRAIPYPAKGIYIKGGKKYINVR